METSSDSATRLIREMNTSADVFEEASGAAQGGVGEEDGQGERLVSAKAVAERIRWFARRVKSIFVYRRDPTRNCDVWRDIGKAREEYERHVAMKGRVSFEEWLLARARKGAKAR